MKRLLSILLFAIVIFGDILHIQVMAGDILKQGTATARLTFDSFDGGGPEYSLILNSDIVSWKRLRKYAKANHEELDGAGYTITYTFTGLKPGETRMTIQQRSPIAGNLDIFYSVKVDEKLNVEIKQITTDDVDMAVKPVPTLVISANGKVFYASLEQNSSARAFTEKLSSKAITVVMQDYGDFEKVGPLPWSLERNDCQITTKPGDIILYQGNQITIYYDTNTWNFTRLAKIEDVTREKLLKVFGEGNVSVDFWVEWSE